MGQKYVTLLFENYVKNIELWHNVFKLFGFALAFETFILDSALLKCYEYM